LKRAAKFFLALTPLLMFAACGNQVFVVNRKEKVIERNAPPKPAAFVDNFTVDKAHGKANLLWVIDNSYGAEVLFDKPRGKAQHRLQQGYEAVLNGLENRKGPLQFVNARSQVVLSPTNKMAGNFARGAKTLKAHFDELFALPNNLTETHGLLISSRDARKEMRDYQSVTPFASLSVGAADKAFEGRADARAYVIFVLASRSAESIPKAVADFEKETFGEKAASSVDVFNVIPGDGSNCSPRASRPDDFLREQIKIGWKVHSEEGDICSNDATSWAESILKWIENGSREFRLSFTPEEPETMSVVGAKRSYQFGTDYTYDAGRNQLIFAPSAGLEPGELIQVHYSKRSLDLLGGN